MLILDPNRKQSYQKSLAKHGESPKALQWNSYLSAALRYREIVADIDITGHSVLDAGCGMGDLLPYLLAKTIDFSYLGVDITPELIEIARKRYDGFGFAVADPFSTDFTDTFDIIISSGVMNSNIPGWMQKRQAMITKLFNQSKVALAFNMAGGKEVIENTNKIAYANSAEILEFCKTLSDKVSLRDGYHSKDFTITMVK